MSEEECVFDVGTECGDRQGAGSRGRLGVGEGRDGFEEATVLGAGEFKHHLFYVFSFFFSALVCTGERKKNKINNVTK